MNEFVSGRSVCLVDSHAECSRVWISQADGLLPVYFQTEEPETGQEKGQATFVGSISKPVYSIACQHCARNNFGVATPRTAAPHHFL
jgi:hypothetical protein